MVKVLIVDDCIELCNAVSKIMKSNNYEVECAYNGQKGLRMALENEYDVILLDIMMPQMNGYKVLENIRKEGRTTPVILITAKNEVSDKIEGLELGADDYIQKPFNTDELMARIRALARRSNVSNFDSNVIHYADITLTSSSNKISKNEIQITLLPQECAILKYFIKNSSVVLSLEKIFNACKLNGSDIKKADKYIDGIRNKLKFICSGIQIIFIREIGYKLCY